MDSVRFIKSFSKGQITIPKEFRKAIGVRDNFWLKLTIKGGKIVAEPVEKEKNKKAYSQKLLAIKGQWFSPSEFQEARRAVEKRLEKLHGQNPS
ncbi:hypothetical protein A3I53_00625 [Candidatus Curtissbacteria bacterium RIFCSPLOWO2_02_FULL_40_13b]|uniref:SpoVT-AbrB domain-containing protein n=1 Tax=Candidatus Curtissbacteria bacterium RIFCSPLOWO2_02_FULL_40_13b TaxID=1797733 RepID=A0A1F5HPW0_9BACT|nr:MAG: hypothetical protein A3I53_00625 [Candidatus Curtissbacteria bacterium RIFCSPLOWO2_02_FULL_40_13b]